MSGKRDRAEQSLQSQAMLLVKLMGELFEEVEAAKTPDQHKAAAQRAWTLNASARAWTAAKRVVDAAFGGAPLGKGGGCDGREPRGMEELEEQVRLGTERIRVLLGKPPTTREERADAERRAGGGGAGLAGPHGALDAAAAAR